MQQKEDRELDRELKESQAVQDRQEKREIVRSSFFLKGNISFLVMF